MWGREKSKREKSKPLNYDFSAALRGKKIPLLVLDEKWLQLFLNFEMPPEVDELRKKLNKLLTQQGKISEEIEGLKRYKSQLLQEIVENMGVDESAVGALKAKKMDKNQRLVAETKEKLAALEEVLNDLPREMNSINEELLVESSKACYRRIREQRLVISDLDKEIKELSDTLKQKQTEKNLREDDMNTTYTYLHNMFGPKVMEILDAEDKKLG